MLPTFTQKISDRGSVDMTKRNEKITSTYDAIFGLSGLAKKFNSDATMQN